jgi:uncharacterized protein YdhG (YjbR/CyaY superfamily)
LAGRAEVVANCDQSARLEHSRVQSYAFTEHGAIMAASVLKEGVVAIRPRTIDEVLGGLSEERRAALQKLRKTIKAAAPEAEECIAYGVPAFRLGGKFLVGFGTGANHCSFYPGGTAMGPYRAQLAGYDTSKGTIRFQPGEGLPAALVRKIVRSRVRALGVQPQRRK